MLDIFNTPTPQKSNYQEFYGGGTARDWIKPRGASMVRMILIGAGAGGRGPSNNDGGGSGAVTSWIGPAIFIPDVLRISIGAGGAADSAGGSTTVIYQAKDGTGYTLLTANGAASRTGGTVSTNNYFGASGIFSSIAGVPGGANAAITLPTTIFLSGGSAGQGASTGGAGFNVPCPYGYPTLSGGAAGTGAKGADGFFLSQPIMFGVGGAGGAGNSGGGAGGTGGRGGIGCGGGGGGLGAGSVVGPGGRGGDGAVFIWAW